MDLEKKTAEIKTNDFLNKEELSEKLKKLSLNPEQATALLDRIAEKTPHQQT